MIIGILWGETYGSVLGSLRTAALECDAVALVLQALGSDQALDLGGLGVGLGALLLGLDLATDDELADLYYARLVRCGLTYHVVFGGVLLAQNSAGRWQHNKLPRLREDIDLAAGEVLLCCQGGTGWRRSYERTHIIFLAETEEAADLGGALGAEALGVDGVGEAGDVGVALLDDGESEDGQVHGDDAAADGLALALTGAAGTVARVAVSEEETDTGGVHDTLLHGEALLVVTAGDAEDVALELVADGVAGDFLSHAAVHEDAELALVLDLDQLLSAIVGVGDVELHRAGGCGAATLVGLTGRAQSRENFQTEGGVCRKLARLLSQ